MSRVSWLGSPNLLLLTFGLIFAGCASKDDVSPVEAEKQAFDDLRSEIRDVIDDQAREDEAIVLLDSLATELEALRSRVAERKQRIRKLNANYDTPRAEFDAYLLQANQEIQENRRRIGGSRRAFIAIVTPDELSAIRKVRSKAMIAAIKSIQAI